MIFSLNEIESAAKKAVRGAGLDWGFAEEGAKAVRWLAAQGMDGCPALADVLDRHQMRAAIDHRVIVQSDGRFVGRSKPLCPLTAGTILCDQAAHLDKGHAIVMGSVVRPLLLLPFLARAAGRIGKRLGMMQGGESTMVVS